LPLPLVPRFVSVEPISRPLVGLCGKPFVRFGVGQVAAFNEVGEIRSEFLKHLFAAGVEGVGHLLAPFRCPELTPYARSVNTYFHFSYHVGVLLWHNCYKPLRQRGFFLYDPVHNESYATA